MLIILLTRGNDLMAESASEEPGAEGSDGPDEEPAVGRQRHADTQEVRSSEDAPPPRRRRPAGIGPGFSDRTLVSNQVEAL